MLFAHSCLHKMYANIARIVPGCNLGYWSCQWLLVCCCAVVVAAALIPPSYLICHLHTNLLCIYTNTYFRISFHLWQRIDLYLNNEHKNTNRKEATHTHTHVTISVTSLGNLYLIVIRGIEKKFVRKIEENNVISLNCTKGKFLIFENCYEHDKFVI